MFDPVHGPVVVPPAAIAARPALARGKSSSAPGRADDPQNATIEFELCGMRACLDQFPESFVGEQRAKVRRKVSFPELGRMVDSARLRLEAAGVRAGTRVGILLPNRLDWIVYDLALIELRAVCVALVPGVIGGGLAEAAERYALHLVVCERDSAAPLPLPTYALDVDDDQSGPSVRDGGPCEIDPHYEGPSRVFSSGSTGRLRCIAIGRAGVEHLVRRMPSAFGIVAGDRFLLFLPIANFQQHLLVYGCLFYGVDLLVTEPGYLMPAMRSFAPTLLLAPPAFYEAISDRVESALARRPGAFAAARFLLKRAPRVLAAPLARRLGAEVRATLGGSVRIMITGMAPTKRRALELFDLLRLPLFEVYGMTECGMIAWNTPRARKLGSVGRVLPGTEVLVASDGELLVQRKDLPSLGYLFEDEDGENARTYVAEGVVATGDLGHFDHEGFLYVTGRKKHLLITSGGAKIQPESIERELNVHLSVANAIVSERADRRSLAALIVLRDDTPAARTSVKALVEQLNPALAADAQITRVAFTTVTFTPDNGLLTANLKLNRAAIAQRFAKEVA